MSLSLFQSPGSIVALDDDPDYLAMLSLVAPKEWYVRFFVHTEECIRQLQLEPPLWEADAWAQQELVDNWRQTGAPLIPQILRYWSRFARRRYGLTQVCVVDYSMPEMNGLQMLGELVDWPGMRVLLTGQADEQIAVQAFNRGLIEQFIPKHATDVSRRLIDALVRLQRLASGQASQVWRGTLTPMQNALLRQPSIARAIGDLILSRWVEYVVIGAPFGVLGRDADGNVGWLQLEPSTGLEELAEMAESVGAKAEQLEAIREGRTLIDIELGQALGRSDDPAFGEAFEIGPDDTLLGALFAVPEAFTPGNDGGYNQWLAAQPARVIRR
ncbi:response regulator [Rhodoferax koreense]|uniref:Response regulator n=1 Tax=Rhodoferax koreensis TaxID=1842727 RepID=A0A1P8JRC6_9BURK|nr:response regulator [Rhodoferax koreense]APW36314.1 response regulator [Rhodoferax koreense]